MLLTASANPGRRRPSAAGKQPGYKGEAIYSNEWADIYEEGAERRGRWGDGFASVDLSNPDFIIAALRPLSAPSAAQQQHSSKSHAPNVLLHRSLVMRVNLEVYHIPAKFTVQRKRGDAFF